ncbi:TolC family protein [Aquiflexum gelatinilyticum]|uniref:TolC family protein n=1 Tax=Aquiflexum gelatinilyticum TaxID=2961943 RepID=A0A9X2P1A4_9BACT|nr:TolC family protein [Aquiflexum gelatinilyticum]MCR9013599.1 TolC family protein [Aquiflexum gelatinilyticum]
MTFNKQFMLLLFMIISFKAGAQTDPVLVEVASVEELIKLIRTQNPDLKSYLLNVEKSSFEVKASKSVFLPSVTGSFGGQKNFELPVTPVPGDFFGQPGGTVNAQFGQEYAYNAGLNLTMSLIDWQSMLKVKMAKLTYEAAEAQQAAYLQLLDQQVHFTYYALVISKQAIALAEKDMEIADSIASLSEQKFREGTLDAIAANQAGINSNVTRQNLTTSRQLYQNNSNDLKLLLGLREVDSIHVVADINYELPPKYSAIELVPDEEIRLARIGAQQAQNQVNIQKSLFVPKLSLYGYYGKQQFRENFGIEFGNNSWTNYSYLGLNFSIPIFTGFSTKNKLRASKVDLELAEYELNQVNLESQIQDAQLIEEYHSSLINANLALEAFRLYEKNERLTLQKYSEGLISLDRYLYAFEDYLKAENAFLNSLLNTYSYYSQIIPRIQ